MQALRVFVALLSSRKAQVALATIIVAILAAFGLQDFPTEVIMTVIGAIATLGSVLINAIKAEDVASKTAAGVVAAAQISQTTQPTVGIDAQSVNVTTGDTPQ